jgi:GT2 family glycosyltransferase
VSERRAGLPSASVVVVTYNRPEHVRTCLERLATQTERPAETVVIDASLDDATYRVVTEDFPEVVYLRNPFGAGSTATSRNIGLNVVKSDIIAFLDDDAYAYPNWLEELLSVYEDPSVGGVGGRVSNDRPGEELEGVSEIGMFLPNGTLTGYFAADPGRVIEVDHLLGASMSFRRQLLVDLGGIHDAYPGTCLREESDIALRVKFAGWKVMFTPTAVVDHVAGPYAKGRRFDLRYTYYGNRNHLVLLSRVVGPTAPQFRRYLGVAAEEALFDVRRAFTAALNVRGRGLRKTSRTFAGGILRAGAIGSGVAAGLAAGVRDRKATR